MFLVMSDKKKETMSTWMCVNPTIEQELQASLCHHAITTQLPKSTKCQLVQSSDTEEVREVEKAGTTEVKITLAKNP